MPVLSDLNRKLTAHEWRPALQLKDSRIIGLDELTPVEDPIACGNDGVGTVPTAGKRPCIRLWKAAHDFFHLDSDLARPFLDDGL